MFFNPNNLFIGIFCLSLFHKLLNMRGKLEKIGNEWYVKYAHYDGGGSFRLPLHPDDQGYMNCFLYVDKDTEVDYKEMLVNPMGREVDPNNLGQNHSGCI